LCLRERGQRCERTHAELAHCEKCTTKAWIEHCLNLPPRNDAAAGRVMDVAAGFYRAGCAVPTARKYDMRSAFDHTSTRPDSSRSISTTRSKLRSSRRW